MGKTTREEPSKKRVKRGSGSNTGDRTQEDQPAPTPERIPNKSRLTKMPPRFRPLAFDAKFTAFICERQVKLSEFEGFLVERCFERLGWGSILEWDVEGFYPNLVRSWMRTLTRGDGYRLTGYVDNKPYTITPTLVRNLFNVDNRFCVDGGRATYRVLDLLGDDEVDLTEAMQTVFGLPNDAPIKDLTNVSEMTLLARVLWKIVVWNVIPRTSDMQKVRRAEVYVLNALLRGSPFYSFGHLVIDNLWDMYDKRVKGNIPHCYILSRMLMELGARSGEEMKEIQRDHRSIDRSFIGGIEFVETEEDCILRDRRTGVEQIFNKQEHQQQAEEEDEVGPVPIVMQMPPRAPEEQQEAAHEQADPFDMRAMMISMQQGMDRQFERERVERARDFERAHLERQALAWNQERHRYAYELEEENRRRYFDEELDSLAPMSRQEYYDTQYPAGVSAPQYWVGREQPASSQRYPAPFPLSRMPVQQDSRYYQPNAGYDYVPPEFEPFFHGIFGTPPPPPGPQQ